jgi:membrane associated rhomboid family serine protease
MFIPYEVDAPFDHRPVVNWLAIVGIVLVFVLQVVTSEKQAADKSKKAVEQSVEEVLVAPTVEEETAAKAAKQAEKKREITGPMARFALNRWGLGLFTYSWLSGGIIRFLGNLIFLWPFGNAVCGKLGNKLYLPLFLGFGLLAGGIHLLLGTGPAVGADAIICGIVGIYIVLFPEDTMSCFFLLPRPMAVSISGCWVVALWFIFDILEAALSGLSTTYYAHVVCAGAGGGLAMLMLKKNWLVMEKDEKSLLQMLSREKKEEETGKEGEKKDSAAVAKPAEPVDKAKAELNPISSASYIGQAIPRGTSAGDTSQQKSVTEAKKPEDDFIRFRCDCGHRIKVHKRDAGKAGRCPKCSKWVEAPRG